MIELKSKERQCYVMATIQLKGKEKHYIEATKGRNVGSLKDFEFNYRTNFGIIEVNSIGWQSFNDAEKAK